MLNILAHNSNRLIPHYIKSSESAVSDLHCRPDHLKLKDTYFIVCWHLIKTVVDNCKREACLVLLAQLYTCSNSKHSF